MRHNLAVYKILEKKKKVARAVVIGLSYANPEWKQSADGEADI